MAGKGMLGHRAVIVAGIATLVAGVGVSAGAAPVHVKAQTITFSTPNVLDPMESVGEPTIVHSPAQDNTVYGSGPWGTGTQRSIWEASADLGETFRLVTQCAPTTGGGFYTGPCVNPNGTAGTASPPGGGDTEQKIDHNGKDYFADLWALACQRVATTSDFGAHASQNPLGCTSSGTSNAQDQRQEGSDRQWLAAFDPQLWGISPSDPRVTAPDKAMAPLMYMEYNNLQTTQSGCSYWFRTQDGLNYTPSNNMNGNFGCDGYPSVDQFTGKVFEASGCSSVGSSNPALCLNIGTPIDSAGNLCFLDDAGSTTISTNTTIACPATAPGLIHVADNLPADPDLLFTVSSMDTGRNLHITYATNGAVHGSTSTYQVYTTVAPANNSVPFKGCSTNCWNHWATPVQISQSPANVNVFPWTVAGGPGRSDSVWYGTDAYIDPSTNGTATAGFDRPQAWWVWMNQVVWPVDANGAVTLAPPATDMVRVSPHPAHYNSICLQGTGCITSKGDRNLADFFSVTLDHNGAAEVMYDDTSNGLIQPGFNPATTVGSGCQAPCGILDHPGAPVVTIARQDSGPGLFGADVTTRPNEPTSAPTYGQYDPYGDAKYPVIGGNEVNAMDFVNDPGSHTANQLSLSVDGSTLTVKMSVANLTPPSILNVAQSVPTAQYLQFVTRWVMCGNLISPQDSANTVGSSGGCRIFYAMAETHIVAGVAGAYQFYGGPAGSIELCSVSACDPHVEVYPENASPVAGGGGHTETGAVNCPASPGPTNPCTITVIVNTADIGNASASSYLEEVGSYAFASSQLQSQITNPNAEADLLPLQIDGVCCFNFGTEPANILPETPWGPALLVVGTALIGAGALRRRTTRRARARLIHSPRV